MSQTVIFHTWVNDKNDVKFKTNTKIPVKEINLNNLRKYLYTQVLNLPPTGEREVKGKDGEERYYWEIEVPSLIFRVNKLISNNSKDSENVTNIKGGRQRKNIKNFRTTFRDSRRSQH